MFHLTISTYGHLLPISSDNKLGDIVNCHLCCYMEGGTDIDIGAACHFYSFTHGYTKIKWFQIDMEWTHEIYLDILLDGPQIYL